MLRLKPHLLRVKEEDGFESYVAAIKNCVAGCKVKWKSMPKVCCKVVVHTSNHTIKELKSAFVLKVKAELIGANNEADAPTSTKDRSNGPGIQILPRSGWDLFREEQREFVIAEGYTGKEISSQLGERWRSLSVTEKELFKRRAKNKAVVQSFLSEDCSIIERSLSLFDNRCPQESSLSLRRKSF